jgi:A/G-specific adenine glycosylase
MYDFQKTSDILSFRKMIYSFFDINGRTLPWRTDYNPYHIFISEVMLQQTQVDRVTPKFSQFIEKFPTFKALADANLDDVLGVWQGLGYNRRAVSLRDAARIISLQYNGLLPSSPNDLKKLPGIGSATAASIAAFAFNSPTIFLETNIRTVFIYHFFSHSKDPVPDSAIIPLCELAIDEKNARKWYSALMDYGTVLKKQVGNLSQKSKGYKKQTPFTGSVRQMRGAILKQLLIQSPQTTEDLSALLEKKPAEIMSIIEVLLKEGIISNDKGKYCITK